ncbi:hypothetical protein ACSMEV_07435 [Pseudomonas sp. MLB6B]
MSNSMGIASAFILSALVLSPLARAEESPAFAARNQALAEQAQAQFAQQGDDGDSSERTAAKALSSDRADS